MRSNNCLLNGRTLDKRTNLNARILSSTNCLLYRMKLILMIISRNPMSLFKILVVYFDNLTRDGLIYVCRPNVAQCKNSSRLGRSTMSLRFIVSLCAHRMRWTPYPCYGTSDWHRPPVPRPVVWDFDVLQFAAFASNTSAHFYELPMKVTMWIPPFKVTIMARPARASVSWFVRGNRRFCRRIRSETAINMCASEVANSCSGCRLFGTFYE